MEIKIYPKDSTEKLSANFRVSEFACRGSGCCQIVKIDEQLVDYLQQIRDHFGKVIITSAYRCEKHNKNVGGATGSRHVRGQAADFVVPGVAPAEVAKFAESIGVKGIGLYEKADCGSDFVHIDTRTAKSFWYGHKQEKRTTFGGMPEYSFDTFVREVQSALGAAADGKPSPETLAATVTVSAIFNRAHPVVKPLQKWLAALGYEEVGEADGTAGSKFTAAVAAFQEANGCKPTGLMEEWGKTWQKILRLK